MSYKLQEKALLTRGLEPTEKLVLIALAHYANDATGECWPAQKTISEICERTEKRVNQLLDSLCEKRLIAQMCWHGATLQYKVFPSAEEAEEAETKRKLRKAKYHAAAAERGKKIKEKNKEKREAKAARHPMDGISEHPMDGIQTNKENQESNQEDRKENNLSGYIIRQDNILESNIEAPPQVLSDDVDRKIDFDFDSHEVFGKFLNELSGEFAKQGMGAREITLRLAGSHSAYLAEAEKEKATGWKHVKTTPELWCKGVWRNKAKEYNGYDLTTEDLLEIVREHYSLKYPQRLAEVNEVLADTDSDERILLDETAARDGMPGAWEVIYVKKAIEYTIEIFAKPMENACSFCIPD